MNWSVLVLLLLTIVLVYCIAKNNLIQGFVNTMESVVLGTDCPNYLMTDGSKFYLIFNARDFDGVNNPLTFDTLAEARIELQRRGCPAMDPVYLRRKTGQVDPTESYERVCAKHVANPQYWINDCAFGIAYSDSGLEPEEPNVNLDEKTLAERRAKALEFIKKGDGDKFKLLRQLNDFLNSQDTATQVDYDVETCMIDRLGKDMPELGGADKLQKYNKYYNINLTGGSSQSNTLAVQQQLASLDEQALAEFDAYFKEANSMWI